MCGSKRASLNVLQHDSNPGNVLFTRPEEQGVAERSIGSVLHSHYEQTVKLLLRIEQFLGVCAVVSGGQSHVCVGSSPFHLVSLSFDAISCSTRPKMSQNSCFVFAV